MKHEKRIVMRKIVIILSVIVIVISGCRQTTTKQIAAIENNIEDETIVAIEEKHNQTQTNPAEIFVKHLTNEENLQLLFNDKWTFIYHVDDRRDGSTDGQISNLPPFKIDEIIRIKVMNDGNGWLCDKKEPKEFYLDFNLKERVKDWDRIEIPNYEIQEKNVVYVNGWGESDYIKLYYDDNNLIVKMEYRREDPG
jgi:hypothetical protein